MRRAKLNRQQQKQQFLPNELKQSIMNNESAGEQIQKLSQKR